MLIIDPVADEPTTQVRFVGGPRGGRTEPGDGTSEALPGPGGRYRRSVRCADDLGLRYVWEPDPDAGSRLAAIVRVMAALGSSDGPKRLRALMADDVVWLGVAPGLACTGSGEVIAFMGRHRWPGRLTGIEIREVGDQVAVVAVGPDFPNTDVLSSSDPRALLFTFRDGRILRIETLPTAVEAFARLGA
jgi:ketosteroid isomerase-like protein